MIATTFGGWGTGLKGTNMGGMLMARNWKRPKALSSKDTTTTTQPSAGNTSITRSSIKGKPVTSDVERSIFDAIKRSVEERAKLKDYLIGARRDNSNAGLWVLNKVESAAREGYDAVLGAYDELKKARDLAIKGLASGYGAQLGALHQALSGEKESMRRLAASGVLSEGAAESALEKSAKAYGQAALSSYAAGSQALVGLQGEFMGGIQGLTKGLLSVTSDKMSAYPQAYSTWQVGEQALNQLYTELDSGSPTEWLLRLAQATYYRSQSL